MCMYVYVCIGVCVYACVYVGVGMLGMCMSVYVCVCVCMCEGVCVICMRTMRHVRCNTSYVRFSQRSFHFL